MFALGDTIIRDFTTHNPSTGAVSDADTTPTCEVFEEATDTPVLSPTVTKRTGKTGNYRVSTALTSGNGFEDGKSYNIVVSATVNSIAAKGVIESFSLENVRLKDLSDDHVVIEGYIDTEIAAIQTDLTTLLARLTLTRAGYLDELGAANLPADIDTLLARLTAVRAGYLDKLNITGNVAASSEVTAIQNNTRVRVIVPPTMERPDSGSTAFKLHLYIYDLNGNMEAPDSLPTITAENQSGVSRAANLGGVTLESTGHYSVTYTADNVHAIEQLIFEWTVVEGGVTRQHGATAQIVDTTAVDFTASDRTALLSIQTQIGTAGDGLVSIGDTRLAYLDAAISSRSSHSATDVWSSAARTLTAGTNIVLAKGTGITGFNDIAAADVWAVGTRALTDKAGYSLSSAGVAAIHDEVIEGTLTAREIKRLELSMLCGKISGAPSTTLRFRDLADTKDRIVMTVDTNGNRSAVVLDAA